MIYSNILVPYDNSHSAMKALKEAVRFAQEDKAVLLRIINIIDTQSLAEQKIDKQNQGNENVEYRQKDVDELYQTVVSEADALLHSTVDDCVSGLQNEIIIELLEESIPGEQIISYARQHDCDLIIMGSRGFGALRRILGSVSSYVLRHAEIPVMITRED